ncbi:alpha/beta fold hydrolase [Pedobacter sp. 22163]|uniref:alpha/beta fold hydrolase n=1 Tax=Pedobacter sp. 22163 TaxID=3453883 RepID=UPI003F861750
MKTVLRKNIARPLVYSFLAGIMCLLAFTGCKKDGDTTLPQPKTFVFVHGAFQAPYAWQFVKARLEASGHKVVIVELPGHGQDQTPPASISINTYRDKVISTIKAINGPVVLVGHSLGGAIITAVADEIPSHIEKLVYLAGFVPADKQSIFDLTSMDPNSQFGPALTLSADGVLASIANDKIMGVFAQDGNEQVKKLLIDNNRPEPIAPQADKVFLKNPDFAQIPKYYIFTKQDHAITIDLQKKMVATAGIKNVFTVDSGHCPMLTKPDEVTADLIQIIN